MRAADFVRCYPEAKHGIAGMRISPALFLLFSFLCRISAEPLHYSRARRSVAAPASLSARVTPPCTKKHPPVFVLYMVFL